MAFIYLDCPYCLTRNNHGLIVFLQHIKFGWQYKLWKDQLHLSHALTLEKNSGQRPGARLQTLVWIHIPWVQVQFLISIHKWNVLIHLHIHFAKQRLLVPCFCSHNLEIRSVMSRKNKCMILYRFDHYCKKSKNPTLCPVSTPCFSSPFVTFFCCHGSMSSMMIVSSDYDGLVWSPWDSLYLFSSFFYNTEGVPLLWMAAPVIDFHKLIFLVTSWFLYCLIYHGTIGSWLFQWLK